MKLYIRMLFARSSKLLPFDFLSLTLGSYQPGYGLQVTL